MCLLPGWVIEVVMFIGVLLMIIGVFALLVLLFKQFLRASPTRAIRALGEWGDAIRELLKVTWAAAVVVGLIVVAVGGWMNIGCPWPPH